jgi:hypothetical protein
VDRVVFTVSGAGDERVVVRSGDSSRSPLLGAAGEVDRIGNQQEHVVSVVETCRVVGVQQAVQGRQVVGVQLVREHGALSVDRATYRCAGAVGQRRGVIDQEGLTARVDQANGAQHGRPVLDHRNPVGQFGAHPVEPLIHRRVQPGLQTWASETDVAGQPASGQAPLDDGQHPARPQQRGQPCERPDLIADVVHDLRRPHQICIG